MAQGTPKRLMGSVNVRPNWPLRGRTKGAQRLRTRRAGDLRMMGRTARPSYARGGGVSGVAKGEDCKSDRFAFCFERHSEKPHESSPSYIIGLRANSERERHFHVADCLSVTQNRPLTRALRVGLWGARFSRASRHGVLRRPMRPCSIVSRRDEQSPQVRRIPRRGTLSCDSRKPQNSIERSNPGEARTRERLYLKNKRPIPERIEIRTQGSP